ncbi:hypothetical protein K491DRAFT_691806 [Lophiostoma macrostomum CBS 122681]|uniref:TPR-like protein n=1 Tax=Lophiostoma macrostomum CBS 122681 TaxID=1314788 RepID=A0A6A6TBE1_9PLEO|nr:hypothetical protein K491DRAFT_691806 [Lophiostoma macrostomum CBS 122681]
MASLNLHNLDSDTLFELLTLCPDLATLRCLIQTHRSIYQAFTSRRRLVLRIVFGNQFAAKALGPYEAIKSATLPIQLYSHKIGSSNPIDIVAFRESLWPDIEHLLKDGPVMVWATALLVAFQAASLADDALTFSKRITNIFMRDKRRRLGPYASAFFRAAVKTHHLAGLEEDAMRLQEWVLHRLLVVRIGPDGHSHLDKRNIPEHSRWAKDLADAYRRAGCTDRLNTFQLESWELYRMIIGPNSDVSLDWARALVMAYQSSGRNEDALEFHARVRQTLDPSKPQFLAWSRQLIRMYQRQHREAEALIVMRDVWNQLNPESKGYRAWTTQLSDAYEGDGRPEDAVMVCEEAWRVISARLEENPKVPAWQYQAIGAGLSLVRAYEKHGRFGDAKVVEATCNELRHSRLAR